MAGGSNPFLSGSIVSLSAFPAGVNSVFKGWHGGTNGLNSDCTVTMNSDMSISAEFEKVTISDTPIIAELISIGLKEVKSYQFASIFILKLHNKGDQ